LFLLSCGNADNKSSGNYAEKSDFGDNDRYLREYLEVIKELHEFECGYVKKGINSNNYASSYDFRSDVFQEILKDLNRSKLSDYEDINYHMAEIEQHLSEEQKILASEEQERIYKNGCK
jgi:hypothetical protein